MRVLVCMNKVGFLNNERNNAMKELDKGLSISVTGPLKTEALRRFSRQINDWDQALPDVEPLVLDFGLNDFYSTGLIEYWIANETEAGYCGKYLFVFDGQSCPIHRHREKVETFFIVKGRTRMTLDGASMEMNPGQSLRVETGQKHGFTGIGPCLLLELSCPCFIDDNYFENRCIPIGGNQADA